MAKASATPGVPTPRWTGTYAVVIGVLGSIILTYLYLHDPETSTGFLSCPFHWLTGLLCPGCGAQRAVHDLLHGRLHEAFAHNAALVVSIPLLGLQWLAPRAKWVKVDPVNDNRVVLAWLFLLLAWGVLRNLLDLQHHH